MKTTPIFLRGLAGLPAAGYAARVAAALLLREPEGAHAVAAEAGAGVVEVVGCAHALQRSDKCKKSIKEVF